MSQVRVKYPVAWSLFILSVMSLCNPMRGSYFPEFAETHVHWLSRAIQPSHPLLPPSPPDFSLSQKQDRFQWLGSSHQSDWAFTSASVLPMNIHGWFPLGLTGLISLLSKGLSKSSPAPQFKSINSLAPGLLYGPALTSVHDCWKNHSFDYADLFWQSIVSTF